MRRKCKGGRTGPYQLSPQAEPSSCQSSWTDAAQCFAQTTSPTAVMHMQKKEKKKKQFVNNIAHMCKRIIKRKRKQATLMSATKKRRYWNDWPLDVRASATA